MNRGYGLRLRWGNAEKTVIQCQSYAHWHWKDFYRVMDDLYCMVESTPNKVDVVLDLRNLMILPPRFLMHMSEFQTSLHRRVNKVVVITSKAVFEARPRGFINPKPGALTFVNAPEEAMQVRVS